MKNPNAILEFDSIDDLRTFDSEFLLNVDSEIITNICETLKCNPYSYRLSMRKERFVVSLRPIQYLEELLEA